MGFARQVLFTYLLRLFLVPVGLLSAVIVARSLGPAGQGIFAAIGAYLATAAMVGSLGLSQAAARLVAKDRGALGPLTANAKITGGAAGLVAIACLLALRRFLPGAFAEIPLGLLALGSVALPFNLISAQLQALLLGLGRIRPYGFMEAFDRLSLFVGSLLLLVVLGRGVGALIAAVTVFAAVKLLLYDRLLGVRRREQRPDFDLLRRLGGISARAYAASLLAFLVLRSDLMLVHGLLGAKSTGVYSIAVQFADLLLVLPVAVGTLLFPRVAASPDSDNAAFTATVCRHTALAVTAGCLAVAASIHWLIPLLFGGAFQGSVHCLWILLPGVWCMSLQGILANDLAGRDYPAFLPWMWLVLLTVNVLLNLVWLPAFGIAGAAASSTIAYALSLCLVARYWLRRFPGVRARSLFVLEAAEIAGLRGRLKAALLPQLAGAESPVP